MTAPGWAVTATWLTDHRDRDLLVVGPSLGTSAAQLWQPVADRLTGMSVLAWDLPGHGRSPVAAPSPVTMSALAADVVRLVGDIAGAGTRFSYAGDSVGGAVGLQMLLDAPGRVLDATLVATGARIGDPDAWRARAALVRAAGTRAVVDGSRERWFSQATLAGRPALVEGLLATLGDVRAEGYAQVCEALATFDVRPRLGEIAAPVLAVAGRQDVVTPVAALAQIAQDVRRGRLAVVDDVAHLPPVEAPGRLAALIRQHSAAARGEPAADRA